MRYRRIVKIILCFLILIHITGQWKIEAHAEEINGEIEIILNQSQENMNKYLKAFQEKYPDVTVNYTYYADYETEMSERMKSGDYGDVFLVPSFLDSKDYIDYLEPLGTVKKLSNKYNFLEQSKQKENNVYGIPSYAYLAGIVYNKEVFDKAGIMELPKTIDEFYEAMQLIEEHTEAIPFYTNAAAGWTLQFWEVFPFIEMTGDAGYRYDRFIYEINPFSEGSSHYEVYRLLYDLIQMGYTEEPMESDWNQSKTMLNEGKIGCMAIGSWSINQFQSAGANPENIGFLPFPNNIDGKQYITANTDYCYGIASNSENKTAARAFIDFMLDESGYALDKENLSIVKTDPYPNIIGELENIVIVINDEGSWEQYNQYQTLASKLNLQDYSETQRIVEAALGNTDESFDDIMDDWNERWESSRTDQMRAESEEKIEEKSDSQEIIISLDNSTVELSEKEQSYVDENPILKVGYLTAFAPLSYEREGEFCGIARDLFDIIATNTGLTMEYYGYDTAEQLLQAMDSKEIDVISCIEKSHNIADMVTYSKEYLTCMDVLVKTDSSKIDEIQSKKAGVVAGGVNDYWSAEGEQVEYASIGDCIEKVESREADYTITNFYSAIYYIQDRECNSVSYYPLTNSATIHIAFPKKANSSLIALCNKCIYSIPDENMQIFIQNHMESDAEEITLQKFIESNPMFSILVVSAFFLIVLVAVIVIMVEKDKSSRKHMLDVKRYKLLSTLTDEYIFEYEYEEDRLTFDSKFNRTFRFGETLIWKEYKGDDPELIKFLDKLSILKKHQTDEPVNIQLKDKDGQKIWYRMVASTILDKRGKSMHLIGKLTNIQNEMDQVQSYQNKAEKDPLTKLYNRDGFNMRLKSDAGHVMFALLDVDFFKTVNDTLGHAGGDYVLIRLARMLEKHMGEDAVIGRHGGDEFVVFLENVSEQEARNRLQALVASMDTEVTYEGRTKKVSISVGAVYAEQMADPDILLKLADDVLYKTKEAGKNGYRLTKYNS